MYQETGKILEHDRLCEDIYRIRIASEHISRDAQPGQFVLLRVSPGLDPLLRRPFSLHEKDEESFELLYKVAGKGTSILSGRRCGEVIDTIGPLGKGFSPVDGEALLAAGGMGIAPLLFLARSLTEDGKKVVLVYGAKTGALLIDCTRFEDTGVSVKLTTEDGSRGFTGTCVELLGSELSESEYSGVYACGPSAMLRQVSQLCKEHGVPSCQVSVEEKMACGVGACLGCSVGNNHGGYLTVCKDGPVFEASEILI